MYSLLYANHTSVKVLKIEEGRKELREQSFSSSLNSKKEQIEEAEVNLGKKKNNV